MNYIHHFLVRQIDVEGTPGHSHHPLKDISSQDNMDTARQTPAPQSQAYPAYLGREHSSSLVTSCIGEIKSEKKMIQRDRK